MHTTVSTPGGRSRFGRRMAAVLAVPVAAAAAAGCGGGEKLTESFIEDRIESESGQDVDLDFDLDGGNFSIQTPDGELNIQTDADGNVLIEGGDESGDFSIRSDEEGNVSVEGPDGETQDFSIQSDSDGMVIESDEGTAVIGSGSEVPADFPGAVPLPDGMELQYSQSMTAEGTTTFLLSGVVGAAPSDVLAAYAATLEGAGFAQQQLTTTPDGGFFAYADDAWSVSGAMGADGDAGGTSVTITVSTAPES